VIPGVGAQSDQVFVGSSGTKYGGLFRYGEYYTEGVERPVTGWMQIVYLTGSFNSFEYFYTNYKDVPYSINTLETGWLDNYTLYSTVPMIWHPQNPEHMFHMAYHLPIAIDNDTGDWEQRNCTPVGSGWASNGLNLMCPQDTGFLEDGRLVIGTGDFQSFVATDDIGSSFEWLMDGHMGSKDVYDVNTLGDDIYVVRMAARRWIEDGSYEDGGYYEAYGYDMIDDPTDPEYLNTARQSRIIAKRNPACIETYGWEFLSRGLDELISGKYWVNGIEVIDDSTIYATIGKDDYTGELYKGHLADGVWQWSRWWRGPTSGTGWLGHGVFKDPLLIPGTDKLIVCVYDSGPFNDNFPCGGVWAIDVNTSDLADCWLSLTDPWTHKGQMSKFAQVLECDSAGEYLYVGSHGSNRLSESNLFIGGLLRLKVPEDVDVPPSESDWDVILNNEGEPYCTDYQMPFTAANGPSCPWSQAPQNLTFRLTDVHAITIDPNNPRHVYAGLTYRHNLHSTNGIWEYVPPANLEGEWEWLQITGESPYEPSFGIQTVDVVPTTPTCMIIGTCSTEFMKVNIAASPTPTVEILSPIHAGQPLLAVTGTATYGDDPLLHIIIDGTELGLSDQIELNDSGVSPDWEAGDGIWTADLSCPALDTPAVYELPMRAQDALGYTLRSLTIEVVEEPEVYYRNGSAESDLTYLGTPNDLMSFDVVDPQYGAADGQRDFIVTQQDDYGKLFVHLNTLIPGTDVPSYFDQTAERYTLDERPGVNQGNISYVDFNNDGLQDHVITSGHNGTFRMYVQEANGDFSAVELPASVEVLLDYYTWVASWADYNMDGYPDLYLCRAIPEAIDQLPGPGSTAVADVLLMNDWVKTQSFIDVTASALIKIPGSVHLVSTDAAWGDIDQDGDLDLAVADGANGSGTRIYINREGRLYEAVRLVPESVLPLNNISDVEWIDIDGDGDLDFIATSFLESSETPTWAFLNDGTGNFTLELGLFNHPPFATSGMRPMDYNMDGYMDLLLLPFEDADYPMLMVHGAGMLGDFGLCSSELGLKMLTGRARGCIATDLNGDGASELLFGRARNDGDFICTARGQSLDGMNDPSWVGLRLFQPEGEGNVPAIGTRVVFDMADGRPFAATVGGGGDGHTDHTILIGTGQASPTILCDIYWLSGRIDEDIVLNVEEVNEIVEDSEVELYDTSVSGTYEITPDQIIDFIFTWETDTRTDLALDSVEIDLQQVSMICLQGRSILQAGDIDVECRQWRKKNGRFAHELRWLDRSCMINCVYPFTVSSGRVDNDMAESASSTLSISICSQLGD
jgi:hypothetical protein